MKSLIDIFKDNGLNSLIEEIQKNRDKDQKAIFELTKKVEMLELFIDFNSAIYVQSGASIEPIEMLDSFSWKADDISEFITGLDAVTYEGEKPTRWASDKARSIKIVLPISRKEEKKLFIRLNGGINQNVLSKLKIYIDGKKNNSSFAKNTDEYVFSTVLKNNYLGINTIVNIEFEDYIENKNRHTIGICSLGVL